MYHPNRSGVARAARNVVCRSQRDGDEAENKTQVAGEVARSHCAGIGGAFGESMEGVTDRERLGSGGVSGGMMEWWSGGGVNGGMVEV